ncbi:hypothetical protein [Neobacillus sp. PS3-40]|uniref:hypothetical protein n=1 Tax=Neobacillus sp. PS3-40 TaxID=3070679 RepID=UPI0027DF56EB|nr:hypothetical protein [Neobacillus sp. PS3-40]WML43126.1 hypothetical protein RCG20_15125 [Neobacillus sp. PS3-40]
MNNNQVENQRYLKILLSALEKEFSFQSDGGTSYRKRTAKLALVIAKRVNDFSSLLERENAKKVVQSYSFSLDEERTEDVSNVLHTTAKEIYIQQDVNADLQAYLNMKRQDNNKLSLFDL